MYEKKLVELKTQLSFLGSQPPLESPFPEISLPFAGIAIEDNEIWLYISFFKSLSSFKCILFLNKKWLALCS